MIVKLNSSVVVLFIALLFLVSCSENTPQIYDTPHVESFVAKHNDSEYVILLAYAGTASNSVSEPIINNENGRVKISFTNKKARGIDIESLHTSFRSFTGADRQVSAIIEVSENVKSVSYFYEGKWKQIWPSVDSP